MAANSTTMALEPSIQGHADHFGADAEKSTIQHPAKIKLEKPLARAIKPALANHFWVKPKNVTAFSAAVKPPIKGEDSDGEAPKLNK